MATDQTIPADSWDRYWKHGFLTSCSGAFAGNYEGTLRESWLHFFQSLPKGARILDIGTGNGAVPMIAMEHSREAGRNFKIDAIDKARIYPQENAQYDSRLLAKIQFRGQTSSEHTPYSAGCFDAFTGQYAFEYTNMESTISEMRRIARPEAVAMFIMHHDRSVVMDTAREEIKRGSVLLNEIPLFDKARTLIQTVGVAKTVREREALSTNAEAEEHRRQFNAAAAEISRIIKTSRRPEILDAAVSHVAKAYRLLDSDGLVRALAELAHGEAELKAHLGRLHDLSRSRVTQDKLKWIAEKFQAEGFLAEDPVELYHDGEKLVGWQLKLRRAA